MQSLQYKLWETAAAPAAAAALLLSCSEVGYTWLHEPCREMLSYGLISEGIPERMHPKSFRSTFETHTHVWATRQPRYTPYVKVCLQMHCGFGVMCALVSMTGMLLSNGCCGHICQLVSSLDTHSALACSAWLATAATSFAFPCHCAAGPSRRRVPVGPEAVGVLVCRGD
jgi:hypothetical protein